MMCISLSSFQPKHTKNIFPNYCLYVSEWSGVEKSKMLHLTKCILLQAAYVNKRLIEKLPATRGMCPGMGDLTFLGLAGVQGLMQWLPTEIMQGHGASPAMTMHDKYTVENEERHSYLPEWGKNRLIRSTGRHLHPGRD